ncbi:integrase, catalytic region, zinc finger, CCHC-type containing protein [Tanacetum coccineum]
MDEIETLNIELEHRVTKLVAENEHLKQTYKQLYDSIKPKRVQSKEQCDALIKQVNIKSGEISNFEIAKLQEQVKNREMNQVAKIMGFEKNIRIGNLLFLQGSRGDNLYTLSLGDMLASSPICLLSKASKTKSWLWHRRLSHIPTTLTTYTILRKLFKGLKQAPSAGMICCPFFLETITSQKAQLDPYSVHPRRRQVCQYGISIGGTSSQKHLARESEFEFLINKLECGDLHGYAETIADEVDE